MAVFKAAPNPNAARLMVAWIIDPAVIILKMA
jgi:ABC-type Fe3+ transport system substrate-binding protein